MNNIVRAQQQWQPAPGTRDGNWMWDGTRWVCDPDCDVPSPCPPFGPPVFSGPTNQPPWYPGANGGVSFGTVAPANPVRGHFWWDGRTLWMFDGAAWVATGGSAGGTPPSSTAPANPVPGQQWFNGTTLFVWDGNAWIPVSQTKTFIQATAPPAPNPGDLWWDGVQMHIWDGSTWELVGPGATVGPVPTTTITFAIAQTADVSVSTTAWQAMPFVTTPLVDTQSAYDPVTHKITPKKAGNYLILARGVAVAPNGAMAMLKNDSGTFSNTDATSNVAAIVSATATGWLSMSGLSQMNGTTDFFRFWVYEATGTKPNTGGNPCLSLVLLP